MLKVRDLMTPDVVTVRPATPIKDAARLLVEHRISGMPVVHDGGRVVGVVSEGDLLVKEQDANSVDRRPLARVSRLRPRNARAAREGSRRSVQVTQ